MTDIEQKELLALGRGPLLDYDRSKTVVDLFRAQVERTPDAIAVADSDSQISYQTLEEQSNAIAHWLIEAYGIQPNDFVAVMLPRRKEFVSSVFGIWKTGAAYVPIDPEYPEERKQFMIADCEAKVVITAEELKTSGVFNSAGGEAVNGATPDGLAYMIYTSGSTGKPKGVMVPHSAYFNYLNFYVHQQQLTSADRMGCHRNFTFDASLEDLYPILTVGGALHIMPEEIRLDMAAIKKFIEERKITCVSFTTSLGEMLLHEYPNLPLRYMVVSGEKLNPIDGLRTPLWNFYGPTECTVDCVTCLIIPEKKYANVPIGKTVDNLVSLILDKDGNLVPQGATGELCIAGPQLARGYWKRPELTSEKFVDCPYLPGQKMYRTGDLCRWNDDRQLEYLGRIDNQVKLRGFRMELGEVESVALRQDGVRQAVAVVKNDRLVLYYTGEKIADVQFAAQYSQLPDYMVPSAFLHLDAMPLTPNGKIARKALPDVEMSVGEMVAARSPLEHELTELIRETLGLKSFGVTTNLISIGMTSLTAMRIAVKVHRKYGISVRMTAFMSTPTVEGLAALLGKDNETGSYFGKSQPVREYYPLTANQVGVYIDWEKCRNGVAYNLPCVFCFRSVDAEALRSALILVINAHPVLKMRLARVDGAVVQHRDDRLVPEVTVCNLPDLPEAELRSFFQSRVRPFELFNESLCRLEIYRAGMDCYLFKDFHHLVSDGLSEGLFLSELLALLKGRPVVPEVYTAYDYALEAEHYRETGAYAKDRAYFEGLLDGLEATSYPASPDAKGTGKLRDSIIVLRKNAVDAKCAEQGVTASTYILHGVMQVLGSLTRERKVLIAAVSSGRGHGRHANCQGFFVKTLPVVSAESPAALQRQLLKSIGHEEYPLTEMAERFGIRPQVLYAYQGELAEGTTSPDVETSPLRLETPQFPLLITVNPDSTENYEIVASYDDGKYSEDDVKTLLHCISNMAVCGRLLSEKEEQALITLGTGERLEYDHSETFVDLFLRNVAQYPDATAVVDCNGSFTYRELDTLSDAIALRLIEKGVRPGDFVAVTLPRIKEFLASAIGIWKAGAAYVPIDPAYPEERIKYMLEDSEAKVVIDEIFCESIATEDCSPVNLSVPDGSAYMIYTSGSTGKPKGVVLGHYGLANYIHSTAQINALRAGERISAHRSFSFDSHIEEFYPTLFAGGTVHIMQEEIRTDLNLIYNFIIDNKIDGCYFTTSMSVLMYQNYDLPVRFIGAVGEKLSGVVGGKNGVLFLNTYGPTECTDHISAFRLEAGRNYQNIPIGRPLHNGTVLITDAGGRLVPRGMAGELCFVSPQLAKGYWHHPELTAEKFVDCPYLPSRKMYKTGDFARWNEEGELEFLGRIDNQVKARGIRIELGEIESNAMQVAGMRQVAATVKNDSIVLYWCGEASEADVRSSLSRNLPEYMLPSVYIHLEAMPLTPSGKLDRKNLPEVVIKGTAYEAPAGTLEQKIYDIVTQQLGCTGFGVVDNLISYGLSSIKAMRLSAALASSDINIRVAKILSQPTIREMAEEARKSADEARKNFYRGHAPQVFYPLTENQRLLYLAWLHDKNTVQYNMPYAWYIPAEEVDRTREALIAVVNGHPYLKTRLVSKNGDVMQQRRDDGVVTVTVMDTESELTRDYVQSRIRPFNLDGEDLYRLEVHRTSRGKYRACVVLDVHHILADGLSMQIFWRDLRAALAGRTIAPEVYSACDFAIDQQELLRSPEYGMAEKWFDTLIAEKEVTVYPHSYEGLKTPALASVEAELEGNAVDEYCRKFGFTQSNYFLTAFLYLLREVTREEELLITTINNGRHASCMMDAIGMFVTTLPVAVSDGTSLWRDSVNHAVGMIQCQQFQAQDYDFYPFTQMVEQHGIHAEIMYEYQTGITESENENISGTELSDIALDVAKLPLMLSVDRGGKNGAYRFLARYDESAYSRVDMERMLKMFSVIAEKMPSAPSMVSIDLLDNAGTEESLSLSAGPRLDVDSDGTFVKGFHVCASAHPGSLAVEDENGVHSYGELDRSSDVLAHALVKAGVTPNTFIALLLDRTWFFPLSILAVHKAGAAYVPLDLEYPVVRLQYMLEDCQTKVLLTTRKDFEDKKQNGLDTARLIVIFLEEMDLSGAASPIDFATPSGNAYLAYTSGSTGRPKGVILHQAGLWNFICSIRRLYGHTPNDRIASHRTFSFSAHVEDMVILTAGGSLHIMPAAIRKDINRIHEYLVDHQITGCGFIASVTMLLLKHCELNLRYIAGGGELFTGVVNTGTPQIIHSYGPTEGTVHTSVYLLEKGKNYDRIPVGRPLPNNWMFVVSADGKLLPRGVAGELCFAGVQVAKGYWNNPELTPERFGDCPFVAKDALGRPVRMYHTGDLVRWNEDGYLEHIGRIDNQFKLRGFRIEPGEIENAALKCEGVTAAVVALRNASIVLYWCGEASEEELRSHLNQQLADYMLPAVYVYLETMPLNGNGKIDRKHLPEPKMRQTEHVSPVTEKERFIFDRGKELLGISNFGVTDDLTRFGMNSIQAMMLALGLPPEWGIKVSDVIGSRTIRGMLTEKHDILWFHEKYDSTKKTIAVVHGIIGEEDLTKWEDELSKIFNVIEIEHIHDTILSRRDMDCLVSPDGYNEFIRLYARRLLEIMPAGCELFLLLGFSLGGMMAYDTACEWKNLTGQEPVVLMGDSYLNMSSEENDYTLPADTYEKWRDALREIRGSVDAVEKIDFWDELRLAIRGNKKSVSNYSGRVILLRSLHGYKISNDIAIKLKGGMWYGIVRWLYRHLYIKEFLASKKASKIGILEAGYRGRTRKNLFTWKQYKPDMEIMDADTTHSGIFSDRELIPQYIKLIRSLL